VWFIFVILQQFTFVDTKVHDDDDDDPELRWSSEEGNSQNTYRIAPSMNINYSKMPWIYEYNLTSQDNTQFGQGAGINGDLYFFLSETRTHVGKYLSL
jgi:hypothetical protein